MINNLKTTLKKLFANLLSAAITKGATYTVNTACTIGYGQIEEPKSLQRLKKY